MAEKVKKRSLLSALLGEKEESIESLKKEDKTKSRLITESNAKSKPVEEEYDYEEIPDDEERVAENERRAKLKQEPLPKQYTRKKKQVMQSDAEEEATEEIGNGEEETAEASDSTQKKKKEQKFADPKKNLLKALYETLGG